MPTFTNGGWNISLFCGDEKTKEYDIGTPSDNLKKCMVHVDAGDNFCIKIRKTDMSSFRGKNFYVKIVLDGVVYDHFMMYEGVFQVTSLGWQSPSGMVKPYKWCTSNNMDFRGVRDMPSSTEHGMEGSIRVTVHSLNVQTLSSSETPQSKTYIARRPSRTRLRGQGPRQAFYAHIDNRELDNIAPKVKRYSSSNSKHMGAVLLSAVFQYHTEKNNREPKVQPKPSLNTKPPRSAKSGSIPMYKLKRPRPRSPERPIKLDPDGLKHHLHGHKRKSSNTAGAAPAGLKYQDLEALIRKEKAKKIESDGRIALLQQLMEGLLGDQNVESHDTEIIDLTLSDDEDMPVPGPSTKKLRRQ